MAAAEHRLSDNPLGLPGDLGAGTTAVQDRHRVGLVPEPDTFGPDVVAHHEVDALGLELGGRPLQERVRLGGEADQHLPGMPAPPQLGENVGVGTRRISGAPSALRSFVVATTSGR